MARDLRAAALHYLRTGAVTILTAATPVDGPRAPTYVHALVNGHKSTYRVFYRVGRWSCSCAYTDCAHIPPVQMITGYPTPARTP